MKINIVAIHQPDFMPWLGFFLKAWRADILVILDHVKNNPKDGSWFRRVKFAVNNQPIWISIPIKKRKDTTFIPINKMEINFNKLTNKIFEKYKKTIFLSYKRCPYFEEYYPFFLEYFNNLENENSLLIKNMNFIIKVFKLLNINPKIIYSSSLNCKLKKTELLIEIIKKVGGNAYLSGDGATDYLKNELFKNENIKLIFNNFIPKFYTQYNTNRFISGLSILDMLFNIGAEKVKNILYRYGKIKEINL